MTFPRLDVDFHLAPFVDPRDHFGLAQARVRIGAPHFASPREFWVRPVRSKGVNIRVDFLLRSTLNERDALLLLNDFLRFSYFGERPPTEPEMPSAEDLCDEVASYLEYGQFLRYWRHQFSQCAACLTYSKSYLDHSDLALVKLYPLESDARDAHDYRSPLNFSETEIFEWPIRQLDDCLTRQFTESNSELHLTWNWIQIPREKRFDALFMRP